MKSHGKRCLNDFLVVSVLLSGMGVCVGADMAEVGRLSKTGETLSVDMAEIGRSIRADLVPAVALGTVHSLER